MKKILIMLLCIMLLIGCGQTAAVEEMDSASVEEATTEEALATYTIYGISFKLPAAWTQHDRETDSTLGFFPDPNELAFFLTVSSLSENKYDDSHSDKEVIETVLDAMVEKRDSKTDIEYMTLDNGKIFGWRTAVDADNKYFMAVYANDGRCLAYNLKSPISESDSSSDYIEQVYHSMETIEYVD